MGSNIVATVAQQVLAPGVYELCYQGAYKKCLPGKMVKIVGEDYGR